MKASTETIRSWCAKFGPEFARKARRRRGQLGDILVQRRRHARAARRFFRKLLKGQGSEPRWLITDKLGSYGAAHRFLSIHGVVQNLFGLGRHRLRSDYYRLLRGRAFAVWSEVAAA